MEKWLLRRPNKTNDAAATAALMANAPPGGRKSRPK